MSRASRAKSLPNGKASLYEGGVREPCLVVWPSVTKPGTVNDTVIQSIDWMPTLLDMAGVPLPSNTKLDGLSIASVLKGGPLNREAIFTHFPHDTPASGQHPGTSVRRGDWKLIRLFAGNADGSDTLELFNLKDDLGETRDLAAEKREIAKELNALITGFLKETDAVIPKRNPAYKAASQATTKNESGEWTTSKDARLVLAENELRIAVTRRRSVVLHPRRACRTRAAHAGVVDEIHGQRRRPSFLHHQPKVRLWQRPKRPRCCDSRRHIS